MIKQLTSEEKYKALVVISELSGYEIDYLGDNTDETLGDLGMDSLDRLELLINIEKAFNISLENYPFNYETTIENVFESITLKL